MKAPSEEIYRKSTNTLLFDAAAQEEPVIIYGWNLPRKN